MGKWRVADALATLAFDYPPRAAYFRAELETFLLFTREAGLDTSWRHAADVFYSPSFKSIAAVGLGLLVLFLVWIGVAQALYTASFGYAEPSSWWSFARDVITTPQGQMLIVAGNIIGFIFAAIALCVSVVSFPLLLDRNVGPAVAVLTSVRAVTANPVMMALWGLIGGTLGYGVRSVYGYLNTKQKYQLNLTQSLYYQNIDNNSGVLHRILDEAEEQESRETILAYYFLWTSQSTEGLTADELDRQIEAFLRTEAAREVDFEIGDALAKLERFRIVERGPGDKWKALEIDRALEALHRFWGGLLS